MARKRRGREEGSIYERADGLWVASVSLGYDAEGKRIRRVVYGKSKSEVAEKLRRLQTSVDHGRIPEAGGLTVAEFLARWLEGIKPTVAANTYDPYERHCRLYLTPQIGGTKLEKLTALHVQKLYADLAAAGLSAVMRRKVGATLGVALQNAVGLRLIMHNPARDVPKPRYVPREMQALDPDQARRFLAEARQDRLFALYAFLLDSGAREGEAFGLQWSDVDWDGGAVQILRNLEECRGKLKLKDLKTKKSRRRVPLSAFTMGVLAEHRKAMLAEGHYRPEGPVFCNTAGVGCARTTFFAGRSAPSSGVPACRRFAPTTCATPAPPSSCWPARTARWWPSASATPPPGSPRTPTSTSCPGCRRGRRPSSTPSSGAPATGGRPGEPAGADWLQSGYKPASFRPPRPQAPNAARGNSCGVSVESKRAGAGLASMGRWFL
jgi:integrase